MKIKATRFISLLLGVLLLASLLVGCGTTPGQNEIEQIENFEEAFLDSTTLTDTDIPDEIVALVDNPGALITTLKPVASGTKVQKNSYAAIDYSNIVDGYVMAKYTAATDKKIKAQVKGPSGTTYTYNLASSAKDWTTFPLSDGNGSYKVTIYRNTTGTKYSNVLSVTLTANMTDEFAPFLRPNQYVDYTNAVNTVSKAAELTKDMTDPMEKVKVIYNFVVTNFTYDRQKAKTVQSGYLPVLDTVLSQKKGICFDYASVMTAMLRSQDVPCKLVVGYVGETYHAWINVWSEEEGWINAAIFFDGQSWQRMDPTFASSAKQSAAIMKYIGDGSHYTAKYIY